MASVFSKRVIAYILDFIVISALMWIVSYFISLIVAPADTYGIYSYFPYVVPVLIFVYFVLCEKIAGASIGKAILNLHVISRNGAPISWPQALVRNISKIYWVPVIFDWAIGKILKTDRVLNNITRTIVVEER